MGGVLDREIGDLVQSTPCRKRACVRSRRAIPSFAVGYASPSQFSREYAREFGRSPGEDAARLKSELTR